jgi:hypothetical protein
MKKIITLALLIVAYIFVLSVYYGLGSLVAWILGAGLNLNVNYFVFQMSALVLGVINCIPFTIAFLLRMKYR